MTSQLLMPGATPVLFSSNIITQVQLTNMWEQNGCTSGSELHNQKVQEEAM